MGGSHSKSDPAKKEDGNKKFNGFVHRVKSNVEEEVNKRMMMQREVQMAVNIARARDNIWIFGSAWATLTSGVTMARVVGKPVPPVAAVPIVVGGFLLGNMADMAYGNKLARVTREAEYLMEYDRERFVPPKQAPFHKFYLEDEKSMYHDATPVGELFPNQWWARPQK